ncbi:MAG TPA: STAS domain-containing protein [Kofleriaceae bacterium]|nr:STAS domain-containing protein [Kofleriaceae bacterium]
MIEFTRSETNALIRVTGRFDFRCVKQFNAAMVHGPRDWVVDLCGVDYIDSAGLGLLLLLREHAGGDGTRVSLRGAKGQTRDVLLLAKFERMFKLEA